MEFVGKCILEEIFQWIECKEVENLAFKDVNVDQLSDVLSNSTEDLINKGFTIFQAVHDFYKGTLMTYLNNVVQLENPFDTEFLKKMIGVWIGNMVKRRTVVGPPLSARMRDMLQKKAYILIRSYSIVPKEISVKVQFNRLFPDQVEQDAVKIIHEKAKDIKVEVDQEMMSFLNIEGDDKSWLPALSDLQRSGGEDSEPFIHYPGKFVICLSRTIMKIYSKTIFIKRTNCNGKF